MFKQLLWKRRKIFNGWRQTRSMQQRRYDAARWWDSAFYREEITDRATIWAGQGEISTALHYASVEAIILRHLRTVPGRVIDIGSGAGHWLDFYARLGSRVAGCDISERCVEHLRQRHADVAHGAVTDVLPSLGKADLVSAIGVMFHLVDDEEWRRALRLASDAMTPGGILVVGGHFGWLDGINVQWDGGTANKRLRSARRWRRELAAVGLDHVRIARNRAYLYATEPLPENNVLFAIKS